MPTELSHLEFRTTVVQFMNDSDKAIQRYALGLDTTNGAQCLCEYHIGRASVFLEQKLDASMQEAVSVVREASTLTRYSYEMRCAIVAACEQIVAWTTRALEGIGLSTTLMAPPRPSAGQGRPSDGATGETDAHLFDETRLEEQAPTFVFNTAVVKGTH